MQQCLVKTAVKMKTYIWGNVFWLPCTKLDYHIKQTAVAEVFNILLHMDSRLQLCESGIGTVRSPAGWKVLKD